MIPSERERFLNLALTGWDEETARRLQRRGIDPLGIVAPHKVPSILALTQQQRGWDVCSGNECLLCHQPVLRREDAEVAVDYWSRRWMLIHGACRHLLPPRTREQQEVDCCCNDCGGFKRVAGRIGRCIEPEGARRGLGDFLAEPVSCMSYETGRCYRHRREDRP